MKISEEKEVITAKISKESAEGWRNFCAGNGITVTAFIEVAGMDLINESIPPKVKARQNMVEDARKIDMNRRSRRS
ncbi:MAG: hypothetical protein HOH19_11135 [Kordiimonadaceae bacterium]|nr:hypothetical protein [Kordiimonadaceae bacterium]MBT6033122.1 hypothetical protein [Kordiimonadaceae bacterium]